MPRVLVTPIEMVRRSCPGQEVLQSAGFEIVYPPEEQNLYDEQRLIDHLPGIDAMLAGMEPLSERVMQTSKLRVISRFGVGYDAIDIPSATRLGIAVTITPGTNHVSAAEHTMALMLGVLRGLPGRDQSVRDGSWRRPPLARLSGKQVGLVGLGRIGKEVAVRAQAFGARVLAHDPCPDEQFATQHGIPLVSFAELLSSANIVSLHLPCTPATTGLMNQQAFAAMQVGSILINTARGGLVDEEALADALATGRLWGAGLDAFVQEPPARDNRLLHLPNVLLTPHTAGLDYDSVQAMGQKAAECIVSLFLGRSIPMECLVNRDLKQAWNWKVTS